MESPVTACLKTAIRAAGPFAAIAFATVWTSATAQTTPLFSYPHTFSRAGLHVSAEALAAQADGKVIVGGGFDQVNGVPRQNLVRFNADGSVDTNWTPSVNGNVTTLLHAGGVTYVAGNFSMASGQSRNYLAAFDEAGALTAWNPQPDGIPSAMVAHGSNIVVSGGFSQIGGAMRNGLAALNVAGTATAWDPANDDSATHLLTDGTSLYVFGRFFNIDGAARNGAAKFDASFALQAWAPELTYFGSPNAPSLVGIDGSDVIAIGNFDAVNGASFAGQVRINRSTGAPAALGIAGLSTSNLPRTLTLDGGRAYLGGNFYFGSGFRKGIVAIDLATGNEIAGMPALTSEASQPVLATLVSGGRLWIAGQFDAMGGVEVSAIASVPTSGSPTVSGHFLSSAFSADAVTTFARQPDGKVVIGGQFDRVDGLGRKNLVRLNADGSIDAAWNANVTGNDAKVLTLVYDGSRLLVGGNFESVNGTVHPWLAALDDSGALTAWNPAPNNPVHAIRPDGGFVYIAGSFTTVGTTSQNGLSQLDAASGSIVVPAFGNHTSTSGGFPVNAIDVRTSVYVAGSFDEISGLMPDGVTPRHFRSTAALNAGTGTFTSWNPPVSSAVNLKGVAATAQRVYVSGNFNTIAGQARAGLAALNTTTGALEPWTPNVPAATASDFPFVLNDVLYTTSGAYDTTKLSDNRLKWGAPAVAVAPGGDRVYYLGKTTSAPPHQFAFGALPLAQGATAAVKLAVTSVHAGNSPAVGAPFIVTMQSRDASDLPSPVETDTPLSATLFTGTGVLGGGTSSCTILAGTSSCTFAALTYSKAEAGVQLQVSRTGGDMLAATTTPAFNVKRTVTVTLAKTPGDVTEVGQPATFVATISGGVAPGGTVAFMGNSGTYPAVVGCGAVPVVTGSASCTSTSIPAISGLTLRAEYSGDATHFAATSTNDAGAVVSAYPVIQVTKSGGGAGTVTSSPVGISCGTTCQLSLPGGTPVVLSAVPDAGSVFLGWSGGGCTGTGTCMASYPVGSPGGTLTARFELPNQTLSITKNGAGSGTVSSAPAGIDCGATCASAFVTDAVVTLTAVPVANSVFAGWSGGTCSGTSACMVTLSEARNVIATFDLRPLRQLTVTPGANGRIQSSPVGIDCPSACVTSAVEGSSLTLTALPNSGYVLKQWTGACSGRGSCVVQLDQNRNVGAEFDFIPEIVDAQSVKVHGTAGEHALPITLSVPLDGAITIEPRMAAPGHIVRIGILPAIQTIGQVLVLDSQSQTAGNATAEFTPGSTQLTLRLSNVADGKRVRIRLDDVNQTGVSPELTLGFLVGDVGGSATVSAADVAGQKAKGIVVVPPLNARFDINLDGVLSEADLRMLKSRAGSTVP